jgi:chromosome segregation ATPase
LNNRLQQKAGELETTAKLLEDTKVTLAKAEADARAAAKAAEAEIAKREAKIAELESQNLALDKQAGDLKSAIGTLESKIADTEKKLAASEGDREFLLKELKRLQAEKAELERKFNDLIVLREQVRKLKDELDVARRLDWIKKGLLGGAGLKGGPLLQRGFGRGAAGDTNFGLNVELKRDGGAKITTPTNAPPAQNK